MKISFHLQIPIQLSSVGKVSRKLNLFILAGACLKVPRTSSFPLWSSNWIPSHPSFKPKPKFPSNRNFHSLQIRDLIDHILTHWKAPSIYALFDSISAQEILKTRISTDLEPNYIWTPFTCGHFSTSSTYHFITTTISNVSSSSSTSQLWKSLWRLNLNDRLKLFIWKIAWNILPTNEQLSQLFHSITDLSFPLCKVVADSMQHLFFECIFARVAWHHSFWPLDSTALNFSYMLEWIKLIISLGSYLVIPLVDHHNFQVFAFMACDILWFYRNKAFHDGVSFDACSVFTHINKIFLEHFQARHSLSPVLVEKWIPPPLSWVKINFDIAIQDSFSAQAVVCHNSEGQIIHMIFQVSPSCSPNVGEALTTQLVISLVATLVLD